MAQSLPIPERLAADVQRAERVGEQLFRAFTAASANPEPTLSRAVATAEGASVERCKTPYRTVLLPPDASSPSNFHVYLIAHVPLDVGIVGGRHFRLEKSADAEKVLSVTPSTESCLLIPYPLGKGGEVTAANLSHLLSPAPTEFHVFLSLLHKKRVYVTTELGMWMVDNTKIEFLKAR